MTGRQAGAGRPHPTIEPTPAERAPSVLTFDDLYRIWFREVYRWVRALGAAPPDIEDLVQEVFVVVHRKLAGFDGRHTASWLYAIARRTTSDYRRRAWFRTLLRRDEVDERRLPSGQAGPERALESSRDRALFWDLVGQLGERHRVALVLFEIEEYSGEEIAALMDVPLQTVWTRLHHARRKLADLALAARRKEEP